MKAQDLMLGDWVYGLYPSGERYKVPFRISAVDTYPSNRSPRIVTFGGYGFQEESLEPIPITPEILEKNGFRYGITETEEFQLRNAGVSCCCQNGYVYEDISGTIKIIFPGETNGGQIEIYDTKFDRAFCFVWNKDLAVHELQHALWLCGIDKKIIL